MGLNDLTLEKLIGEINGYKLKMQTLYEDYGHAAQDLQDRINVLGYNLNEQLKDVKDSISSTPQRLLTLETKYVSGEVSDQEYRVQRGEFKSLLQHNLHTIEDIKSMINVLSTIEARPLGPAEIRQAPPSIQSQPATLQTSIPSTLTPRAYGPGSSTEDRNRPHSFPERPSYVAQLPTPQATQEQQDVATWTPSPTPTPPQQPVVSTFPFTDTNPRTPLERSVTITEPASISTIRPIVQTETALPSNPVQETTPVLPPNVPEITPTPSTLAQATPDVPEAASKAQTPSIETPTNVAAPLPQETPTPIEPTIPQPTIEPLIENKVVDENTVSGTISQPEAVTPALTLESVTPTPVQEQAVADAEANGTSSPTLGETETSATLNLEGAEDALMVKVVDEIPVVDASAAVATGAEAQLQSPLVGGGVSTESISAVQVLPPDVTQVSPSQPNAFYNVVCPKCGADVRQPAKVWELKGGKSKKNVLIGLFQCQDCRVKFREALTREII